jgi:hypothetical protein
MYRSLSPHDDACDDAGGHRHPVQPPRLLQMACALQGTKRGCEVLACERLRELCNAATPYNQGAGSSGGREVRPW